MSPKPIDEILDFLGHSPSATDLNTWLDAHRIRNRPFKAEQDENFRRDPHLAYKNSRASEVDEVQRHSLALIYDSKETYELLFGDTIGESGDFVLREVAFFGEAVQGYRGYKGVLPFEFSFGQDLNDSIERLGAPIGLRQVHDLNTALWAPEKWIVNASYLDGNKNLGIVHFRRENFYDRRMLGTSPVPPHAYREAQSIRLECLGREAYSAAAVESLRAVGFSPDAYEFSQESELTSFVRDHGLTLYLGGRGRAVSTITGLRFSRRGDMQGSRGYEGYMPFGIEFHDRPDALPKKVGRSPDKTSEAPDTGSYLWHLEEYDLHVMFSLIDFQVYRVSVFVGASLNE